MKLSLILMFAAVLNVTASVYSQTARVTLNLQEADLETVFQSIQEQTEFDFFYKNEYLPTDKTINKTYTNAKIDKVLDEVLEGTGLVYRVLNKDIVITRGQSSDAGSDDSFAFQQMKTITGLVSDEAGRPLPGVTVIIKGTTIGSVTNMDGNYTLSEVPENATLEFSFVGMLTQEIEMAGQDVINVTLAEDLVGIDEVVIVGYGTQLKTKVTGAIAQVSGKEMEMDKRPVTSVQGALVGSLPGLRSSYSNGRPGAMPGFSIRGSSSTNSTSVLVIIDGFEGSLSDLDPQTVENVSILKDAAAVAVYGARGANGVMLITTNSTNKNQELTVSYNFNYSIQKPSSLPGTLSSMELMEFRNTAAGVGNEEFDEDLLSLAASGFYPETVWPEELYQSNSGQQSHNLSVSGGTGKTGYLINASYLDQKGLVIGSDDFSRLNLRLKLDTEINKWLSIGTNALITNRVTTQTPATGSDGVQGYPFFPVKTVDGLWVDKGSPGNPNPVAEAASGSFNKANRDALNIQLYAKIKPVKGLTIEERVSFLKSNVNTRDWLNVFDYVTLDESDPDSYTNPDSPGRIHSLGSADSRRLRLSSSTGYSLKTLTTVNYDWAMNDHSVRVLLGFQSEQGESESFQAGRTGFFIDNVIDLKLGQVADQNLGSGIGNTSSRGGNATTLSYFGRINYDYKKRYLAEFSFRRDGSSNFLDNNKWAFFPAVSLGWNIAEESFLSDVDFIDRLKLRTSYGQSGDDSGVGRRVTQLVSLDVTGYPIGGNIQPSLKLGSPASRDLKWETSTIFNVGLDFSLWKGKLQVVSEYFINNRDDILDEVITPYEFGFGNVPANLYGVKSWGWELMATHKNKVGKVNYWMSANISDYDNEITDLAGRERIDFAVGQSINKRLGYQTDGFFNSQQEIDDYVGPDGVTPINQNSVGRSYIGGYKFVDQLTVDTDGDGIADAADGVIAPDDRVILERNSAKNLILGFNLGLAYEGFSLSARFYGTLDNNQWYNGASAHEPFLNGSNAFTHQLDYWREDNKNATFPVPQGTGIQSYNSSVSHLLFDNEYIKLQNITLSYDFDKAVLTKIKIIKALSLLVSVENVGTIWTNSPAHQYGWDPELGVGSVDYPLPVTTSFGINVKF